MTRTLLKLRPATILVVCVVVSFTASPAHAETIKLQITGLFAPDREADLRETVAKIPKVKLVDVDFKNAEATFEYDPAQVFAGAKLAQIIQRLNDQISHESDRTFGVKALRTIPREKLTLIEIPVAGLDCRACSLAAYEIVLRVEGVEMATASFREGRVTALIDPARTDRTKVEDALKKRGVEIRAR